MEFNKVIRGAKRAVNTEQAVYDILDAGFLCHVSFLHEGQAMMIPTAYGRKGDILYIHGSTKNFMLNQILNGQTICIGVTHLDGIVLAKTLFDTSANYRSAILFGKATLVESEEEKMVGLKIITEHIIKGRWAEVPVGTDNELNATLVIRFVIERASAKIRSGGPQGDEDKESKVWSGHIPLSLIALTPVVDQKIDQNIEQSPSVKGFLTKFS